MMDIFIDAEDEISLITVETPNSKKIVASTPADKGKLPLFNSPTSNITPVAVKELFLCSPRHRMSELSWSSSLATKLHCNDFKMETPGCRDIKLKPSSSDDMLDTENSLGVKSLDLFSDLGEESLLQKYMNNSTFASTNNTTVQNSVTSKVKTLSTKNTTPPGPRPDLSLADLLSTPPSKRRRFAPPPPRRSKTDGPNAPTPAGCPADHDCEDDLLTALTSSHKSTQHSNGPNVTTILCDKTASEIASRPESSNSNFDYKTPLKSLMPMPFLDTPPLTDQHCTSIERTNNTDSLQTPRSYEIVSGHTSAFSRRFQVGDVTQEANSLLAVTIPYKPVRPAGLSARDTKKCIIYSANPLVTPEPTQERPTKNDQSETPVNRTAKSVVPRRLAKFKTPQKPTSSCPDDENPDSVLLTPDHSLDITSKQTLPDGAEVDEDWAEHTSMDISALEEDPSNLNAQTNTTAILLNAQNSPASSPEKSCDTDHIDTSDINGSNMEVVGTMLESTAQSKIFFKSSDVSKFGLTSLMKYESDAESQDGSESCRVRVNDNEFQTTGCLNEAHSDLPIAATGRDVAPLGFTSASGKVIGVSPESILKAKLVMEKEHQTIDHNKISKIEVSDENKIKAREMLETEMFEDLSVPRACKFRKTNTSSFSETSLLKARSILDSVDEDMEKEFSSEPFDQIEFVDETPVPQQLPQRLKRQFDGEFKLPGFSSASGKNVAISKESLARARSILAPLDSSELPSPNGASERSCDSLSGGFLSASGKPVAISNENLIKARTLFNPDNSSANKLTRRGFTSALDKSIAVSPSSSVRDKSFFDESVGNDTSKLESSRKLYGSGFTSASGHSITVSSSSIKKAKSVFEKCSSDWVAPSHQDEMQKHLIGSSPAPSKPAHVSDTTPSKAAGLWDQFDQERNSSKPSSIGNGFLSMATSPVFIPAADRKVVVSEGLATSTSASAETPDLKTETADFAVCGSAPGFATASGKKITPSTESLHKAEILFQETADRSSEVHLKVSGSPSKAKTQLSSTELMTLPPVRKFRPLALSPINTTPNGMLRKNFLAKPIWTTPGGDKKFSYGNKPFKPHTPPCHRATRHGSSPLFAPAETVTARSPLPLSPLAASETSTVCNVKPIEDCKPTDIMMKVKRSGERKKWMEMVNDSTPGQANLEEVREDFLHMTSETAMGYTFLNVSSDHLSEIGQLFPQLHVHDRIKSINNEILYSWFLLIRGVDPTLISPVWFNNHYRWVVWKLACIHRSFPAQFKEPSVIEVLKHIKYRYEREIDNCQRSCLKKIYEGDDMASKPMVLLISSIKKPEEPRDEESIEVELSDGWYGIKASMDQTILNLISSHKLTIGTKIYITSAQLVGMDNSVEPLQAPSSARLKVNSNCARRARWDCRLGYQWRQLTVSLTSLHPAGGNTPTIHCVITRVYPLQYMDKQEDGSFSFYGERRYKKLSKDRQIKREKVMEAKINQFINEDNQERRNTPKRKYSKKEIQSAQTGLEIYELIRSSHDPENVQMILSDFQRDRLLEYQSYISSNRRAEIRQSLEEVQSATPLLKIRLAGIHTTDIDSGADTLMTIWRPQDELTSVLKEGHGLKIQNVSVSEVKGQRVQSRVLLSANRSSVFEKLQVDDNVKDMVYEPRMNVKPEDMNGCAVDSEIDLIGIVVAWEKVTKSLAVVYLSDESGRMVAINFWKGLEAHGVVDVVKETAVLHMTNLIKCSSTRYSLPLATASDLSNISVAHDKLAPRLQLVMDARNALVRQCQGSLLLLAKQSRTVCSTPGRTLQTSRSCTPIHSSTSNPNLTTPLQLSKPNRPSGITKQSTDLSCKSKESVLNDVTNKPESMMDKRCMGVEVKDIPGRTSCTSQSKVEEDDLSDSQMMSFVESQ